MRTDGNTGEPRRPICRRELLRLGGAGTDALAFGGYAARPAAGRDAGSAFAYRGRKVLLGWRDGHPRLSINGEPIVVVDTDGTYRTAEYAFD
jgi:hypothetical protein